MPARSCSPTRSSCCPGPGRRSRRPKARGLTVLLVTKGDLFHQESKVARSGLRRPRRPRRGRRREGRRRPTAGSCARHGIDPARFVHGRQLPAVRLRSRCSPSAAGPCSCPTSSRGRSSTPTTRRRSARRHGFREVSSPRRSRPVARSTDAGARLTSSPMRATPSEARFLVLHGLRLKGFGEPGAVAAAVGLDEPPPSRSTSPSSRPRTLVVRRDGSALGLGAHPGRPGRAGAPRRRPTSPTSGAPRCRPGRLRALPRPQRPAQVLCTDWQVRDGDAQRPRRRRLRRRGLRPAPRASTRPSAAVLADLAAALTAYRHLPAAGSPPPSRGSAAGELDYFTKPIIDSYHTIWFELHEDLHHRPRPRPIAGRRF